ncbi:plasmid recombination protein [Lachnoclostridium edouardi]|uniref:plasmid recombination protein n=1 Tax=Lachnoclostridium edouardi TaxID=1926283 RepID=UPI0015E14771|nr:plasmid recombination protein [Lachnoclostridium edouardi]
MASVQKFAAPAVVNILRHNSRTIKNPANADIDSLKSDLNYSLIPERGISDYEYFLKRKSELYCYNRADVKVLVGWVVTAPQDMKKDKLKDFFEETHNFLATRYGKKNVVQSVVHADEAGQPHLHFCFIPVVPDKKHSGEKICANKVLTRAELRNFHPALQKHLDDCGIDAKVLTGVTKQNGGNRTVKELKQMRDWTVNAEHQIDYGGRW